MSSSYLWGYPYNSAASPQLLSGSFKIVKYFKQHGLAIDDDGHLWASGINNYGQLGIGSTSTVLFPTWQQVGTDTWLDVAGGDTWSVGIKADGSLWHWGNYHTFGTMTSPTSLDAGAWQSVACAVSSASCIAIKQDGTLYSWGYNSSGNLGHADGANKNAPTLVSSDSWISADISDNTGVAVKEDGTLWVFGQTMLGSYFTYSNTPVQVGSATNWKMATTALNAVLAVNTAGELWSWGYSSSGSNYGILGLGEFDLNIYTPTKVAGSDWDMVSATYGHAVGLNTSGVMYAWGYSTVGALGIGIDELYYVPTLVDEQHAYTTCFGGWGFTTATQAITAVSDFWTNHRGQTEFV